MASNRLAEGVRPDDSARAVGSNLSWRVVREEKDTAEGSPPTVPPGIAPQGAAYNMPVPPASSNSS